MWDNQQNYDAKLKLLLSAAKIDGFRFNESKCVFARTKINVLEYVVAYNEIQPDPYTYKPYLNRFFSAVKSCCKDQLACFRTKQNGYEIFQKKFCP